MSIDKSIRILAYPAEMSLICCSREKRAVEALAMRLKGEAVKRSCLVFSDSYCLGLSVKTSEMLSVLPHICEYSDSVCIGRNYPEIAMEHGEVLIKSDALRVLSSEAFNG